MQHSRCWGSLHLWLRELFAAQELESSAALVKWGIATAQQDVAEAPQSERSLQLSKNSMPLQLNRVTELR